jgi:hypothetical protein
MWNVETLMESGLGPVGANGILQQDKKVSEAKAVSRKAKGTHNLADRVRSPTAKAGRRRPGEPPKVRCEGDKLGGKS